jgi:hypothetical protein
MLAGALWSALGADDVRELRALNGAVEGERPREAPALQQPAPGETVSRRPSLRWAREPSAFGYYVQVCEAAVYREQGGFSDVAFGEYAVDTTTEQPEYNLPLLLAAETEYYWRMKARTPAGNSPWSPVGRFNTRGLPAL